MPRDRQLEQALAAERLKTQTLSQQLTQIKASLAEAAQELTSCEQDVTGLTAERDTLKEEVNKLKAIIGASGSGTSTPPPTPTPDPPPPTPPITDLILTPEIVTVEANAPVGTLISTPSTEGGVGPYAYETNDNPNITVVDGRVVTAVSPLTAGDQTFTLTVEDAAYQVRQEQFSVTVQEAASGVQLVGFSITNWGASSSSGFIRMGLLFTQGDIPSGRIPEVRLAGTPLSAIQFDNQVYWPDGSLAFCTCCANLGTFTAGETKSYTLWSITGAYDNTSAKTLADVTDGTDFKTTYASLTQYNGSTTVARGSGAFTASFNTQSAVATRRWKYESGPVADSYYCWGPALDDTGGAADTHLTTEWYVTLWKNADGTVAGREVCAVNSQFWWSIAGKFRLNYNCLLKNGAGTLETYNTVQHPYCSQWATVRKTADNNHAKRHWVDGSAAIPTLLYKPDKDYWKETRYIPPLDTNYTPNASTSSATFTPCGAINHRPGIDGTGAYMGRGLLPNVDGQAFMRQTAQDFRYARTNAHAGLHVPYHYRSNRTRTRPASAGCPGGDASPDTAATITSLDLRITQGGVNQVDPATYTFEGMPIPVNAYAGSQAATAVKDGYVTPAGGSGVWVPSLDSSHAVSYSYFMYLHEGERYFMQATLDLAINVSQQTHGNDFAGTPPSPMYNDEIYRTTFSIPKIYYYGIAQLGNYGNSRHIGWACNLLAHAYACCPDNDVQRGFVEKWVTHNVDYFVKWLDYLPASQLALGCVGRGVALSAWMEEINGLGAYMLYQTTKQTKAKQMGDFFAKLPVGLVQTHIYRINSYHQMPTPKFKTWAPGTNEFYAPEDIPVGEWSASLNAATNTFTRTTYLNYPIANGDQFRPTAKSSLVPYSGPPELTEGELLYAVNVSGHTFQLSRTLGGTPIDFAADKAAVELSGYLQAYDNYAVGQFPPQTPNADDYGYIGSALLHMGAWNDNDACEAQLPKIDTFLSKVSTLNWVTWRMRA